ncbi:MAG: hypothetical protein IKZ82_11955 [Clostridia bacterium]|nr:hypothetical protein [Clostridia bacterium]
MKNATAFVCILEYAPFEPERYAELYTPLRRVGLEGITSPALRVQSAAAELPTNECIKVIEDFYRDSDLVEHPDSQAVYKALTERLGAGHLKMNCQ